MSIQKRLILSFTAIMIITLLHAAEVDQDQNHDQRNPNTRIYREPRDIDPSLLRTLEAIIEDPDRPYFRRYLNSISNEQKRIFLEDLRKNGASQEKLEKAHKIFYGKQSR